MNRYQITFVHANEDWTWIDVEETDYHNAMLTALRLCPVSCRVLRIEPMPEHTRALNVFVHEYNPSV